MSETHTIKIHHHNFLEALSLMYPFQMYIDFFCVIVKRFESVYTEIWHYINKVIVRVFVANIFFRFRHYVLTT